MSESRSARARKRAPGELRPENAATGMEFETGFPSNWRIFPASILRVAGENAGPPVFAAAALSANITVSSTAIGPKSLTGATPVPVKAAAAPSWVSQLSTPSIAVDMAAAIVDGTVSYSGLLKLLNNLDSYLAAFKTSLTAAQFADLKTIAVKLNNGVTATSYLASIMNALVMGDAANSKWTGGGASTTNLGNLAVGCSATKLSELIGKWFLGTDLPSSTVNLLGSTVFSVSYSNSTSPLFGCAGPNWNDINQGRLGDCYLLSCLAEVVYRNQNVISSMITSNGNDTYGVRFYINGSPQYVTVNTSLANGGTIINSGANIWASLVEKAYAQLQASKAVTGSALNYGNSWSTIGNGGRPENALAQITGSSTITDYCASGGAWTIVTYNSSLERIGYTSGKTAAAVQAALIADIEAGDDLILSSQTNAWDNAGRQTLVLGHAMSIYGFDSGTGMFQIRNPWGSSPGQNWLTNFEVSLSTLLTACDTITVDDIGGGSASPKINAAPMLTTQTKAQTWSAGQAVNFTLASNTFIDPEGGKLAYAATFANGSALPSWLKFNAATRTFTGTVPYGVAGLSIRVTASDPGGLAASETFSVSTPNKAPVLAYQTKAQTWSAGQAVNFTLAANTFTDPEGGKLTYAATLANGVALPSWLKLNTTTGTFTGTVPYGVAGPSIKVTCTDPGGLTASETFSVSTPNKAPALASQTAAQTWSAGQAVNFTLASNTFIDPEGGKFTYAATLGNGAALPSWLKFDTATGKFTGIALAAQSALSIKVTAIDAGGLKASEVFNASIIGAASKLIHAVAAANPSPAPIVNQIKPVQADTPIIFGPRA
jgi:hypothetical protein